MNYSEIEEINDVSDALIDIKESLLLLRVCDDWITGLHLSCSEETRKALGEVGFLLRTFLDRDTDQVLDRCLVVLDEAHKRDRQRAKN